MYVFVRESRFVICNEIISNCIQNLYDRSSNPVNDDADAHNVHDADAHDADAHDVHDEDD